MSTLAGAHGSKGVWEPPQVKLLNEAIWQAWLAKGAAQDRRNSTARVEAVKWLSVAVLLLTAVLWLHLTPYEVLIRFMVAAGAMFLVTQTVRAKSYAFAAVFAAFVLLYNPVAPVFSFEGDWQRALVIASTLPFVASLGRRNERRAHND